MSFEEVATPAIEYAENGFPLRQSTARTIESQLKFFERWPDNQKYWLKPDGSQYKAGETIKLPATARTLKRMVEAERAAKAKGREAGVIAARDRFYKGDIAREMMAFLLKHGAPFDDKDFSDFYARIEAPASTTYRGYTVYKHGFGSQGPSLLQTLNILETFDLKAMGYASADYLHTVTEAMKLAYADRDTYYADPEFVQVPAEGLLSKAYAKERAALIDPRRASKSFIAGDPLPYDTKIKQWPYWKANVKDGTAESSQQASAADAMSSLGQDSAGVFKDTTHMAVIDKEGNIFDVTPSGGWINGAVILGDTGIGMSVRGEQFWLDKTRANQIRPRARPRYTLTPSLVFKGDMPMMGIGTPGRRQPGSDHPAGVPQHRRILGRLVSEPALGARAAAPADAALLRLVLAARVRVQQAGCRVDRSRRGVQGAAEPGARCEQAAPVRCVRLCDRGDDRSGDEEPLRRRRPAPRMLRHGVLAHLRRLVNREESPQSPQSFVN